MNHSFLLREPFNRPLAEVLWLTNKQVAHLYLLPQQRQDERDRAAMEGKKSAPDDGRPGESPTRDTFAASVREIDPTSTDAEIEAAWNNRGR